MVPYGYHWWLGSSVVLCQVWVCFTAPWWEKSKLRWDCLPWVSLLISGVWYYPKKCHLLPVSSILFWCQSSSAFSSISCPFVLHVYLLLCLAAFGSLDTSYVPQHPSLFAPLGVALLMCLCDTFVNEVAIIVVQNTQCGLFHFHVLLYLGSEQAVLMSIFIIYYCLFWIHICWKEV